MELENKIIFKLENINSVVNFIRHECKNCRVFAFYGSLGAGKTTIVRALLRDFGVTSPITSPTFTYLNCYKNNSGLKFYHFDLYRLSSEKEFFDSGFYEYISDKEAIVFIEWPEIISEVLRSCDNIDLCELKVDYTGCSDERLVNIKIIN